MTSGNINQPTDREIQIELATTRTLLAMDRTLLAWIRTSLTLIGFGFTLAKLVHDLIANGSLHLMNSKYPREVGIMLMILGIMGLLAGAIDYWRAVKRLSNAAPVSCWSASLVVSLILATVSILVMSNLLANLALSGSLSRSWLASRNCLLQGSLRVVPDCHLLSDLFPGLYLGFCRTFIRLGRLVIEPSIDY